MRKIDVFFLILGILLFAGPVFGSGQKTARGDTNLVVLHTNDFHGHPLKFYDFPAPGVGGLPAIATLVQQIRVENDNVLLIDAGDLNTGRPESNFFSATPDIIGYNYVGYDAMVLGNHEFDKPLEVLESQRRLASFPFISANVIRASDGENLVDPFIIKDLGAVRVGIFGLTTTETKSIGNPTIVGELRFEDEVTTAKRMVGILKPQVDIIIALTHIGLYEDNTLGSRRLAHEVEGIDLIVDGHTNSLFDEALIVNGTPIVSANHWGLYVGKARISIRDGKINNFDWELIPINLKDRSQDAEGKNVYTYKTEEIPEDPYLLNILEPYAAQVDDLLSERIGTATALFNSASTRLEESALGNLVADAMMWYSQDNGADFAIQNGGGVRADLVEGPISKKNIYEVLPFDNSVVIVEMSGEEVIEMFAYVPTIERGKGAFPQVSAEVQFTVDFKKVALENLQINGVPVDPQARYRVATNSYMAAGGDGYSMMKEASYNYDTSAFQRDVVIDYIKEVKTTLSPLIEGRITVIE